MTIGTAVATTRRPRDYQDDCERAVREQWDGGVTPTAVVAATGLGKTDCIAKIATDEAQVVVHDERDPAIVRGQSVLALAHRHELLNQITERCQMYAPHVPVGRVEGSITQLRRPITVASTSTLALRLATIERCRKVLADPGKATEHLKARRKLQATARKLPAKPDVVILDEGHHASSVGNMRILEWAGAIPVGGWNPNGTATDLEGAPFTPTALCFGVTATLTRSDKRGLGMVYRSVAIERGTLWAITHGPSPDDDTVSVLVGDSPGQARRGWLVRPHGRVVVTSHMKLDDVKVDKKSDDYAVGELGEMVAQDVDQIVQAWREHAIDERFPDGRTTVAFTPNIESAHALAAEFVGAGIPTAEVFGTTPTGEREKIYADLGAGRIRVLVCVMTLTEGWDCPPVSCILMARPTQVKGLYTQIVGRGLRWAEALLWAALAGRDKDDCLVLDVVGASRFQKLTTLTDLLPNAIYSTRDLDLAPCEVCGGYLGNDPGVVEEAQLLGMPPCMCSCQDCGEAQNECTCGSGDEGGGRDPDGGRRRLQGPAPYEEIDLLGGLDESPCNWLKTPGGVNFLDVGSRLAAVVELRPGVYRAGHCTSWGRDFDSVNLTPTQGVSMAEARAAVEVWAEAQDKYYPRDAPWRRARKAPSDAAIGVAQRMGIDRPERYTAGGLADEIAIARAAARFDRR